MITIPKQIKVGYQKRQDTYTGQLAYIVYVDSKGVTKKEKSWEDWRDKNINPDVFNNEPTSGFVLNKKVGDYRGRWDGRQAWIRVYDPRNFEFEISVNNLLFILENSSSIKGKGLEGEFVYSWDGKDLLLLPVDCTDYKSIVEEQEVRQKPNLKKKDFKAGYVYKYKDCSLYTYLGVNDYYGVSYEDRLGQKQINLLNNQFVFAKHNEEEDKFVVLEAKNFREEVSECSNYASYLEEFKNSINGRKYVLRIKEHSTLPNDDYLIFKFEEKYYMLYNSESYIRMQYIINNFQSLIDGINSNLDYHYIYNYTFPFTPVVKNKKLYLKKDNQEFKITEFFKLEYVPEGE